MEVNRKNTWGLGTEIPSFDSDKKIKLGCEVSIVPHPISDQEIL